MTPQLKTHPITFVGANIKGTPAMKAASVAHDLKVIKARADVFGVQEFKWPWYWRVAKRVTNGKWLAHPGITAGLGHPVEGAQAIFWQRKRFKKLDVYSAPAFDFRMDNAGIMDNRFVRGALLADRTTSLACWYMSTHFVVGGDEHSDSPRRRAFMIQNVNALDDALTHMVHSGYPVVGELDANVHQGSWAYPMLMDVFQKHDATLHGTKGVEYAFSIDGKVKHTSVRVTKDGVIPTSELATDHESRVLTHELIRASKP